MDISQRCNRLQSDNAKRLMALEIRIAKNVNSVHGRVYPAYYAEGRGAIPGNARPGPQSGRN